MSSFDKKTPSYRPNLVYSKRQSRGLFKKIILGIVGVLAVLYVVNFILYFTLIPKQPDVFAGLKKPLLISHQGGENIAPSNTIAAFDKARQYQTDVMETDIHMTKDGHLVAIHDNTVDRTTNGTGRVDSYNLADLQKLDAGYHFKDLEGQYSYRGKGTYIPTLDELFERYGKDYHFNVEIKARYPQEGKSQIEEKLWELIKKYNLQSKVIVNSFDNSIVQSYEEYSKGESPLGAGKAEVVKFVLANKSFLKGFYRPDSQVLQIPTSDSGFNLKTQSIIDDAHRLNMQVHYWTIDDKETMKELIELGADGVMTNRPDLLLEVMQEMGLK